MALTLLNPHRNPVHSRHSPPALLIGNLRLDASNWPTYLHPSCSCSWSLPLAKGHPATGAQGTPATCRRTDLVPALSPAPPHEQHMCQQLGDSCQHINTPQLLSPHPKNKPSQANNHHKIKMKELNLLKFYFPRSNPTSLFPLQQNSFREPCTCVDSTATPLPPVNPLHADSRSPPHCPCPR